MSQLGLWGNGDILRDAGLETTEVTNRRFVDIMREHAVSVAGSKGVVSSDDLREHAHREGLAPEHPNAWGAIFRAGKTWKVVGRIKSKLSSNHSREIRVWALVNG